ncbi:MAG: formylglycine-generating enzyme family protein [Candidatus Hydrogenedentota bacterium]
MNLKRMMPTLLIAGCLAGCSQSANELNDEAISPKVVSEVEEPDSLPDVKGMVLVAAGSFMMGSSDGFAHESPRHEVTLDAFYMDEYEVTNGEFARFVKETGFVTEAEQWKWSIVFAPDNSPGDRVPGAEWWKRADSATWRHPNGPETDIEGLDEYPVVQVSWNDATAYAAWAGKRLPTEAEWEYAARGGLDDAPYAWGLDFAPGGEHRANTWNGQFPVDDSGADGYKTLAPIGQYKPNGYGLYDIAGNVWEWVEDWYGANYYRESPRSNPTGPEQGVEKIQRGGSFMCAANYCLGYRVSHRGKSGIDSGLPHTGFRCVRSVLASD